MYKLTYDGYRSKESVEVACKGMAVYGEGVDYYSYGKTLAEFRIDKRDRPYLYLSLGQRYDIIRNEGWDKEKSVLESFKCHNAFFSSGVFFDAPNSVSALIWTRKPAFHKFLAWPSRYVYVKDKEFWYKNSRTERKIGL